MWLGVDPGAARTGDAKGACEGGSAKRASWKTGRSKTGRRGGPGVVAPPRRLDLPAQLLLRQRRQPLAPPAPRLQLAVLQGRQAAWGVWVVGSGKTPCTEV